MVDLSYIVVPFKTIEFSFDNNNKLKHQIIVYCIISHIFISNNTLKHHTILLFDELKFNKTMIQIEFQVNSFRLVISYLN
jgi:hypothetical protein